MRVSYNWLQLHFKDKLPSPEVIADALIFHSFEVEGIEKEEGGDHLFDLKILPDRAHDCLCHLGISREVAALFDLPKPLIQIEKIDNIGVAHSGPQIIIEDEKLCRRYVGRVVRNIKVGPSPERIKRLLESIGQRSINNIVDSANFVMFEMGQPLHAFDLDKIKGDVRVRRANKGEKIQTLDDKEIVLSEENLVIADDDGPIAIAGVKGGKRAGVSESTKNILLESANFDPVSVRRTSTKLALRTDASKRFENDYPRVLADEGIKIFSGLIKEVSGGEDLIFEDIVDIYPSKSISSEINFSSADIFSILGIKLTEGEIVKLLSKTGIKATENNGIVSIISPDWRLDINILPDIAEEIGRLYGYEKVVNILPAKIESSDINFEYELSNQIKEALFKMGFSEIYTYSLTDKGEVEIDNPLARDKAFLRSDLKTQMEEKIEFNLRNNLFDQDPVRIFEIGKVFNRGGEERNLCIGVGYKTKKLNRSKVEVLGAMEEIFKCLKVKNQPTYETVERETLTIVELPLREIAADVGRANINLINREAKYEKISHYPRSVRDVALFVPPETKHEYVAGILKEAAGELLVMEPVLFDVFEKKDESGKPLKRSLAFRLVFQSEEKTLSEEEINGAMDSVVGALKKEADWQIR